MAKTPLDLIANDPHVIAVLPGEDWETPGLDLSAFHNESHAQVRRAVRTLQGFVHKPYILDAFGNHDDRRKWIAGLTQRFGEWVEKWYNRQNCLRYSVVGKITSPDSILDFYVLRPYQGSRRDDLAYAAERIKRLDLGHRRVYDAKSPLEKVEYVLKVKRRVHDLLHYL